MQKIRIIEIPPMKAAYSGPMAPGSLNMSFLEWFSQFHATLRDQLAPRDFMRFNERRNCMEWFYALPEGTDPAQTGDFEIVELPAGLFAVASCMDADFDQAADWLKTRSELMEWAESSGRFKPYENGEGKAELYPMFRIVSPGYMYDEGISIEDLYFPIERRAQK